MKTFVMDARRVLHVARVVAIYLFASLIARYLAGWGWLVRRVPMAGLPGPLRLRRLFEDVGGSFIKFGQMLALQPDILPRAYCDALFDLLDRIAPCPLEHVEQVIEEELGRPVPEIFDRFDPEPLATASIGQVHVAYVAGQKVAVKVQRPGVDIQFEEDIRLILLGMRLIHRFQLKALFYLLAPMGEFVTWTREELDYRREARYADRLRRNAADKPYERVPAVFWDLTTRRMLVVEYLEGHTVLGYLRAANSGDRQEMARIRASGLDPDKFSRHIIANFLGDAFRHGVFHADLHPANLLIQRGDIVAYVDFGITGVLSRYSRRRLIGMTLAYSNGEVETMTELFFELAAWGDDGNPDGYRRQMVEASRRWYGAEGSDTPSRFNFTLVMLDMLIMCRENRIWPMRDVVKYIRSAIAADGLIQRLAPGFDVGRYLEEECRRLLSGELRREMLSWNTLGTVVDSSRRLAETGPARLATILRRLADGDLTAHVDVVTPLDRDAQRRRRTVRIAAVVVALTGLIELTPGTARFGLNVFTVEAALTAVATVTLAASVVTLARAHGN